MSDQRSKRPESVDDLADYEKKQTLVSISLTEVALSVSGSRVLSAAEQLVTAFRWAYPDELTVTCELSRLEVVRALSESELAERLRQNQASWDYLNRPAESEGGE